MTRIALEAYEIAADAKAFPQHPEAGLRPWAVSKFYLPAWSGAGDAYDDSEPPPARAPSPEPHAAVMRMTPTRGAARCDSFFVAS